MSLGRSLHTLQRLAQRRMDDVATQISRIHAGLADLQAREASLLRREASEAAAAEADAALSLVFGSWATRLRRELEEVRASQTALRAELAAVQDRLMDAYREKSKFEELIERRRALAEAERAGREQQMLDEVALTRR